MEDVTEILFQIEQGNPLAAEQLLPLVYAELRRLAAAKMAKERKDHTLDATALVHEAYVRLVDVDQAQGWNSRRHFFAAAAEAMRRILVESARRKAGPKAGGSVQRQEADVDRLPSAVPSEQVLAVSECLDKLARQDPPVAELVKLRYFAGLSLDEAASALGISSRTASRYWTYAKIWLHDELL